MGFNTGRIIWLYGMSGAGKTTLGTRLAGDLNAHLYDGDVVRKTFNISPKFDPPSRREYMNMLRNHLYTALGSGGLYVVSAITPYLDMRVENRNIFISNYYEVFIECDVKVLIKRDVKGLYKKALAKEIDYFTGISDVFEPGNPDLIINTEQTSIDQSYETLYKKTITWLYNTGFWERIA